MVLDTTFIQLCKYCSEEVGSIFWSEKMIFPSVGFAVVIVTGLTLGFPQKDYSDLTYIIVSSLSFVVALMMFILGKINAPYLVTKITAIINSLFFGFNVFSFALFCFTLAQIPYFHPILNSSILLIIFMIFVFVLMLHAFKKNMLSDILSMLYHTNKSGKIINNYAIFYISGIVGGVFAIMSYKNIDNMIGAFLGGLLLIFGSYIILSSMLSIIYYFIQIKHPELRFDDE